MRASVSTLARPRSGTRLESGLKVCDVLEKIARVKTQQPQCGRDLQESPFEEQGIKVLGSPVGYPAFVARQLERTSVKHQVLFDRIPMVEDVQSAWLLLLHCACARVNYLLRVVRPSAAAGIAETHDQAVWDCLASVEGCETPPRSR